MRCLHNTVQSRLGLDIFTIYDKLTAVLLLYNCWSSGGEINHKLQPCPAVLCMQTLTIPAGHCVVLISFSAAAADILI